MIKVKFTTAAIKEPLRLTPDTKSMLTTATIVLNFNGFYFSKLKLKYFKKHKTSIFTV